MEIFFTEECCTFFKKICKNPSHKHLKEGLYSFFKERDTPDKWKTGFRISKGPNGGLFLKDRFEGSGGYRFYFLVTIDEYDITISSFYPKKGKYSKSNLNKTETKESLKSAITSKMEKNRFKVDLDSEKKEILFVKEKKEKVTLVKK